MASPDDLVNPAQEWRLDQGRADVDHPLLGYLLDFSHFWKESKHLWVGAQVDHDLLNAKALVIRHREVPHIAILDVYAIVK